MKGVELYAQVRYAVQIEGVSRREAARRYGIDPRTVAKMLAFSVPPGYRRSRRPARPKLDSFTGIIDRFWWRTRVVRGSSGIDRLTHHVHILEMNGDSYRLKQSKQRQRRT